MQIYMSGDMSGMLDDYADTVDFYDVSSYASHETIRHDRQKLFDRWVRRSYSIEDNTMNVTVNDVTQPITAVVQFSWQYSYASSHFLGGRLRFSGPRIGMVLGVLFKRPFQSSSGRWTTAGRSERRSLPLSR